MADHEQALVAHQFEDAAQQKETSTLGMWIFLSTEILFFGGMFMGYIVYRSMYPEAFALGSRHLNLLIGSANTAILLTSSLTMALAVHAVHSGKKNRATLFLIVTMFFGLCFLGLKATEYTEVFGEHFNPGPNFHFIVAGMRQLEIFFLFYFLLTAVHALHMIVGVGILSVMLIKNVRGRFSPSYYTPIEVSGLYWHFVDIIWIFLYPLLYLISAQSHL